MEDGVGEGRYEMKGGRGDMKWREGGMDGWRGVERIGEEACTYE